MGIDEAIKDELKEALKTAFDRGYQAGYQAGYEVARGEIQQALAGVMSKDSLISPDSDIDELGLAERARNCLKRARVDTVGQLAQMSRRDLLDMTMFGEVAANEVSATLAKYGYRLKED